jgi:hypothetical protein
VILFIVQPRRIRIAHFADQSCSLQARRQTRRRPNAAQKRQVSASSLLFCVDASVIIACGATQHRMRAHRTDDEIISLFNYQKVKLQKVNGTRGIGNGQVGLWSLSEPCIYNTHTADRLFGQTGTLLCHFSLSLRSVAQSSSGDCNYEPACRSSYSIIAQLLVDAETMTGEGFCALSDRLF